MFSDPIFWIGVASGLFAGASLGILALALVSINRELGGDDGT